MTSTDYEFNNSMAWQMICIPWEVVEVQETGMINYCNGENVVLQAGIRYAESIMTRERVLVEHKVEKINNSFWVYFYFQMN